MITSAAPTAVPNLVQIRRWGASGQMGEIYRNFFLFIPFFHELTYRSTARRRIFTLDGSDDADSRKDVPFGGLVDIAPHFRGEIPRKTQFLGRE